ncbi:MULTISPECIES: hypothetical protein [Paenibacillus]|jgi:hypothetical protein|uniref:Uncharacterized protein n=4 Tax=Paenibacillus TaxID=44249 RepID=E3EJ97_PAEPS|nr:MULTISPECIES: hypothetical protein [Paenibacillus]KAF6637871.1 hypothetical protein H6F38_03260 [Paenibacillus sp. EKM208P]ADO56384.1 hypothetical protein PPSC2_11345 [Paenibacillus polymyxa SC2]AHC19869.1 hypothetical protein X809_11705 [Paenibacillus polymyxa CR1]ALA42118.1 hypothetical protein ABE82_11515 [Paenibacillus peoriae]AOK92626.1 hypothetical protein AOU00_24005 [Paenibacillus polymyxa]
MIKESRMTTTNEPSDLWMTRFLRESEQKKKQLIREARKNNDIPLMNSISFHLAQRDQQHLIG